MLDSPIVRAQGQKQHGAGRALMGSMLVVDQDRANIKRRLQDLARPTECGYVQLLLHHVAPTVRGDLLNAVNVLHAVHFGLHVKVLVPLCGYVFKLTKIYTSQMLMQA